MAKNPILTIEAEALIAEFYSRHPTWKAREIQKRVSQMLHTKHPELPRNWPGLSAVQKVLAVVRKKTKEPDPEGKPWSMATLDEYPIPPDAIPAVLKVWKSRIEKESTLTIREAKWAARLSAIEHLRDDIAYLSLKASDYSREEYFHQLMGRPFDNSAVWDWLLVSPHKDERGCLKRLAREQYGENYHEVIVATKEGGTK